MIILISACQEIAFASFSQIKNNSITGTLLKSNGRPLPYIEIELVPVNSDKIVNDGRLWSTSSSNGKFGFYNLPAGKYTLSVNFDDKPTDLSPYPTFFYPNTSKRAEAEVFEIISGDKIKNLDFRLPPALVKRKITGKVIDFEGKPVSDAFVSLRDVEFDDVSFTLNYKTDKTGSFTLVGFESRRYLIGAILFDKLPTAFSTPGEVMGSAKSEIFVLDAQTQNITLRLGKTKRLQTIPDKSVGKLILNEIF